MKPIEQMQGFTVGEDETIYEVTEHGEIVDQKKTIRAYDYVEIGSVMHFYYMSFGTSHTFIVLKSNIKEFKQ